MGGATDAEAPPLNQDLTPQLVESWTRLRVQIKNVRSYS